jgi:hypothetical protein
MAEGAKKRRKRAERPWLLAAVAKRYGLPVSKLREYCEQKKIREAKRTPGGQWRIAGKLSAKTERLLTQHKRDPNFGKIIGDFTEDEAAWEQIDKDEALLATAYPNIELPLDPYGKFNQDKQAVALARRIYQAAYGVEEPKKFWTAFRAAMQLASEKVTPTPETIAKQLGVSLSTLYAKFGRDAVQKACDEVAKNPDELLALSAHTGEFYRRGNWIFLKGHDKAIRPKTAEPRTS